MQPRLGYALLVIALGVSTLKGEELSSIEVIESLSPLKILKELEKIDSNSRCLGDIKEYVRNLKSNQLWALTMFDATAKIPDGLLLKNSSWVITVVMGQYDECLGVTHPDGKFTGQHCMVNINLNLRNLNIPSEISPEMAMLYGICLPSTCSPSEIKIILQETFNRTHLQDVISVDVDKDNCHSKESAPKLSAGDWVVVGFLILCVVITAASTCYDVHQQFVLKNKKPNILLASFSVYSNGSQLFKISKSSDQMEVLHGIRVFSLCWVMLVHVYENLQLYSPVVDVTGAAKRLLDHNHVVTLNGYLCVDSFFFLSGLLLCYVFFRDVAKKGSYDVPLAYINRYMRLTPPYAVVILVSATIVYYFGDGPVWHKMMGPKTTNCRERWWLGLLYVQNYVAADTYCIEQSWYLAADMQLHWVSPLVLYPLFFWPSLAGYFLCFVILLAAFTNFAIAYGNDLYPNAAMALGLYKQTFLDYNPFHTRAAPFVIGIAMGYVICTVKAKKIQIKLSKFWVITGWIIGTGLCLGSLYGVVRFLDSEYTAVEAAFNLAFHRVGWGLGLAWIVFACVHGYGGPINGFLSWNVFQPLSKLTYCTYLIHMSFQFYRVGILRVNLYGNDYEQAYLYMGDVMIAFLAAIPFTLIFEMPVGNLYRYFMRDVKILPFPKKINKTITAKPQESNVNDVENRNKNI